MASNQTPSLSIQRIEHLVTCPESKPNSHLPRLPNGRVDMNATPQCNCNFLQRLADSGFGLWADQ